MNLVLDIDAMWDDPHLAATGFFRVAHHPTEGAYWTVDMPVRFSRTPSELTRHAPRLGEQSVEVLREAGHGDAEIETMIREGVTVGETTSGA